MKITGPESPYAQIHDSILLDLIDWTDESSEYYGLSLDVSALTDTEKESL